jgi:hypothetical protein
MVPCVECEDSETCEVLFRSYLRMYGRRRELSVRFLLKMLESCDNRAEGRTSSVPRSHQHAPTKRKGQNQGQPLRGICDATTMLGSFG